MFAASTYDEIEAIEQQIKHHEIVVFLFVRPTNQDALNVIKEFEYIHYSAAKNCSVYAIGYSNDFKKAEDTQYCKIELAGNENWYFSTKAFVDFKEKLEQRIKWKYSGETEVLILQNNPGKKKALNFKNYVAIDINKGTREGYIDSFQLFMESLIRCSKKCVTTKEAMRDLWLSQISIKEIILSAIDDCKSVPQPAKKIIKNKLFYRCANSI